MSATIARFSSSVVRSASRTCRTSDFATRHTTGVSRVEQRPHLRVVLDPDAGLAGGAERDQLGVPSFSSVRARAKNSVSLGSAPGQPPSMNPTPISSSSRATASLSATE